VAADFSVTAKELEKARKAFEQNEPRDLFYRAATELVGLALRRATSLTLAEALAVLLQTWNRAQYHYRKFDAGHFSDIDGLLRRYGHELIELRRKSIERLVPGAKPGIVGIFESFETRGAFRGNLLKSIDEYNYCKYTKGWLP